jgi:hypothetical protein
MARGKVAFLEHAPELFVYVSHGPTRGTRIIIACSRASSGCLAASLRAAPMS